MKHDRPLQDFSDKPIADTKARLHALRDALAAANYDGFLIPRSDEYQGEYVPPANARLEWLTGFSGSAGLAIVLAQSAALFVDGRYILQAPQQVNTHDFEVLNIAATHPVDWIKRKQEKHRIAIDPRLHTLENVRQWKKRGITLHTLTRNPIDTIWKTRPPAPASPVRIYGATRAGQTSQEKRSQIAASLKQTRSQHLILTLPENIAWILNIRGDDVPHTPFALSFAILHDDARLDWFIDQRRLSTKLRAHIGNSVHVHPPEAFGEHLKALTGTPQIDPATSSHWVRQQLDDANIIIEADDPIALPKSCKTPAELRGAKRAHVKDGAALTRFLFWLKTQAKAPSEISAAQKLEALRKEHPHLLDLSFDSISGAGANGAIVHYRVSKKSNQKLKANSLYLIDSGGQYLDGTTDVTRTVLIGKSPPRGAITAFTAVLRGHIALARARFPRGTDGIQLDALARAPLWELGMNFDHGTGHGVGAYLSVHEGPQRISKGGTTPLAPGMIVSNEPGYYAAGRFGIRIENLQYVVAQKPAREQMLGFEVLTLAPIERCLINANALTHYERDWLDAYHARVYKTLARLLTAEEAAWLKTQTAPI